MHLPIVDLADALNEGAPEKRRAAKDIRAAAQTSGFFYVVNHGIPEALVAQQFDVAAQFFRLPTDLKQKVAANVGDAKWGYEAIGSQRLDEAANVDLKESFQFGMAYPPDHPYMRKRYPMYRETAWPESLPQFKSTCIAYYDAVANLSKKLLQLIAISLDLNESYFSAFNENPSDSLRLLWYPPHPTSADAHTFGAGSHTDWGALTILAQDAIGGLEVQMLDGTWVAATPVAGAFVVNLGDMMPRWTNGLYRSNHHRVINRNGHDKDRQSVAYFADLDVEATIEPIPHLIPTAGGGAFAPCTVGDHLAEMYRRTYG